MRKIKKISITETSFKIFENIVSSKTWDNKVILEWIKVDIESLYETFQDNEDDLFPMVPKWYVWDTKKALIHCFNDTVLTKDYKIQIKALENKKCPYCYLEYSSQVEHYLPKDEFPEFSFMIDNLLPCCWTCNNKKWGKWKDFTSRVILNFYLDAIPNDQFLFVDLQIKNNVLVSLFKIDTLGIVIDKTIGCILSKHVKKLNLLGRYEESINDKISELIYRIKLSEWISKWNIKVLCKSEADTQRSVYWNNYFVTVLYDEISKNDDIIKYLFQS